MNTTPDALVPKPRLAEELGVSSRTLSRWLDDDVIAFPRPLVVRNRNFFRRSEVENWKIRQALAAARPASGPAKKIGGK